MSASRDAHCLVRFSLKSARKRERICRHHRDLQCPNGDGIYTLLYALYKYSTSITNQPTNQKIVTYIHSVAHCLVSNTSPDQLTSPQGPPRTSRLPQDPAAWTSQAPSPGLTPAAASLSSTLPASPH